jgi:phosphatidylserine/phosphatidylglycerophosphate/cardiolipin synthase-like enzyme
MIDPVLADRRRPALEPGELRNEMLVVEELGAACGVLHAKGVVADDEVVFVTSANLTEAALDRNIEVGLLVRDRLSPRAC